MYFNSTIVILVIFFAISGEWIEINDKYYHFSKEKTIFSRAQSICLSNGGKLFEPKTESDNNEIHSNLLEQMKDQNEFTGSWLGKSILKRKGHNLKKGHKIKFLSRN